MFRPSASPTSKAIGFPAGASVVEAGASVFAAGAAPLAALAGAAVGAVVVSWADAGLAGEAIGTRPTASSKMRCPSFMLWSSVGSSVDDSSDVDSSVDDLVDGRDRVGVV